MNGQYDYPSMSRAQLLSVISCDVHESTGAAR